MMPEATQVAGLGENGEGVGRTDARHGHQSPAIGIICQQDRGVFGDALAQLIQDQILLEHQPEHRDCSTIECHGYAD
jgi:hypothetical protein